MSNERCPVCGGPMNSWGTIEFVDDVGPYTAELHVCRYAPDCPGYLETDIKHRFTWAEWAEMMGSSQWLGAPVITWK